MPIDENSEVDLHPERSSVTGPQLAWLHGISLRTIQRMVARGELTQQADGRFNRATAIDQIAARQHSRRPQRGEAGESLDNSRASAIQRKLDREAADLIELDDALGTLSIVSEAFLQAVDEIERLVPAVVADRSAVAPAIANVKAFLAEKFAKERMALKTGKRS